MSRPSYIIQSDGYEIYLGNNVFEKLHEFVVERYADSRKFIIVDEHTHKHCLPAIDMQLDCFSGAEIIEIDAGEEYKNIEVVTEIWRTLSEAKADRHALLINLGGGVITDLGGFVASTYKRGIDFINIPTTLLAQVDASVGGKVGIDLDGLKNQVGLFNNPRAVFLSPVFLKTLGQDQILSGFAEIIKHALIRDKKYWREVKTAKLANLDQMTDLVHRSIQIKNEIVLEDPREQGGRRLLNFGHTAGHAFESYFMEIGQAISHGQAVAMGMVCELFLSHLKNGLAEREMQEVVKFINRHFIHYDLDTGDYHRLIELMKNDKKNRRSRIRFTLLDSIGSGSIDHTCTTDEIIESLEYYRQHAGVHE